MVMMGGKTTRFRHENGRIILVIEQLIWGEWVTFLEKDVTDEVMPIVDDYLDHHLGLSDYKHTNGRISYTGEKKYDK
jgi:hypothetical protein